MYDLRPRNRPLKDIPDEPETDDSEDDEEQVHPLLELLRHSVRDEQSWKEDLSEAEVEELEPQLENIRSKLDELVPSVASILKSDISEEDKTYCISLHDQMSQHSPGTTEFTSLAQRITAVTAVLKEDSSLDKLRNRLYSKTPTIARILNSKVTEDDKTKTFMLFESLRYKYFGTDEWNHTVNQINSILDAAFETQEELEEAQRKETELKVLKSSTSLKRRIFDLEADNTVKRRLYDMYEQMTTRESHDSTYLEIKNKINLVLQLPFNKVCVPVEISPDSISRYLADIYKKLDTEIYGLKSVKEKIIQTINNRIRNPNTRSLIALKGKPGLGKTKLAEALAKATGLPFDKISLGGSIDSTIFKGSSSVWSGSAPSLLLKILSRLRCSNGIVLLDEVDKLGLSDKGIEVQNSLLHVLDPSQNKSFQDLYLDEFSHDISRIWFILSMNDDSLLDRALKDRLDIIEIQEYTTDEMVEIIRNFTLPKALEDKGLERNSVDITAQACKKLLLELKSEGLREVERVTNEMISKINLLNSMKDQDVPLSFSLKNFSGLPYTIQVEDLEHLHSSQKPKYMSYYI